MGQSHFRGFICWSNLIKPARDAWQCFQFLFCSAKESVPNLCVLQCVSKLIVCVQGHLQLHVGYCVFLKLHLWLYICVQVCLHNVHAGVFLQRTEVNKCEAWELASVTTKLWPLSINHAFLCTASLPGQTPSGRNHHVIPWFNCFLHLPQASDADAMWNQSLPQTDTHTQCNTTIWTAN